MSIVMYGGYEDDEDGGDVIIYTGQGVTTLEGHRYVDLERFLGLSIMEKQSNVSIYDNGRFGDAVVDGGGGGGTAEHILNGGISFLVCDGVTLTKGKIIISVLTERQSISPMSPPSEGDGNDELQQQPPLVFDAAAVLRHSLYGATKTTWSAQRNSGENSGYASSFTGRFSSKLPWKETFLRLLCQRLNQRTVYRRVLVELLD
ncbi:hypothetical protein NE237_031620 [Protea cynaroides]|uniref:YDG domain-containing protein n=1 Tax=Protea cynaroides TaxID=273540 RepID=A0A9Q0L1I0_9MAGN|nr:hypothetical protein NE237_031620 [Protea cynaroides]